MADQGNGKQASPRSAGASVAKGREGMPKVEMAFEERVIRILDMLVARLVGDEGRAPNFYVDEFDLQGTGNIAGGERLTRNADFMPDRWAVYFRADANVTLRVYPGDSVPAQGAVEIENGRYAVLESVGDRLSFHNTGSADGRIFAIAMGGGAHFEIGSIA